MPAIWNIGNVNQLDNKKISSKLTFEEGETFKGMVVGKGCEDDEGSVIVRLTNGWQFPAELLEDFNVEGQHLVQFKVDGFEDGKVKLKIINDLSNISEGVDEDVVKDFIEKEGMNVSDKDILKAMVKFNIPLTKENIELVKTMINFNSKVKSKEGVEDFINKYIAGKNIEPSSTEALEIKNSLTEFFSVFKNMSKDEILLFLENGIDINTENIESYNALFKGDTTLKEYFDSVSNELSKLGFEGDKNLNLQESQMKGVNENEAFQNKQSIKYSQAQSAGLRVYDDTTANKSKVSLLNLLRTITGNENNVVKDTIKNILLENKNEFKGLELNNIFNKLDNMTEDEVKNMFNNFAYGNALSKESVETVLEQIIGKNISLSNSDYESIKSLLDFEDSESTNLKGNEQSSNLKNTNINNEELLKNSNLSVKDLDSKVSKEAAKTLENVKLTSTS